MPDSPARVYECYVESFDQKAKTLNARSRRGKRFRKVSYLFPYINLSGTGIHFVPEEGAECLIIQGADGLELVLGFRMPFSVDQGDREEFPAGSMGLRSVSEDETDSRVMLMKGGTILLESKKSCRTLYSPAHSSIQHIFSTWEMSTPMGFVKWERKIGEEHATYKAEYNTNVFKRAGFSTSIEMSDAHPLHIKVEGPGGFKAFEIKVNPDFSTDVFFASVRFKSLGAFHQQGADMQINLRPVLPYGDPI